MRTLALTLVGLSALAAAAYADFPQQAEFAAIPAPAGVDEAYVVLQHVTLEAKIIQKASAMLHLPR